MTAVITHSIVTGAAADSTALVDGVAWDANHTITGQVSPSQGGTGVANNDSSTLTITGSFGITFTVTATTSLTLPTSGTLATTAGASIPTLATGDILYASAANTLSALAGVATGNALISGGVSTAPAWGKIGISTHVSGLGTGIATALAVNTGSAGAPVLFDGAGGTPSSITLTNGSGLPVSTGISGFGTGVATALAVNVGSAGAFVTFNGALGTPSSGTLTNATGLPISTGVSGLGTGIATALAVNTGSAGAPVLFNGALGTPSSGTVTNLTGTASININGTVGATTPGTGAFTTLAASGLISANGGQIAFPATQNASADANTLDDYEEGTWTPNLKFGGATTGITYSSRVGRYSKIGNRVILKCDIVLTSKGSATGSAEISGIPFNGASDGSGSTCNSTSNVAYVQGFTATGAPHTLTTTGGGTLLVFNMAAGASTWLTDTAFANNTQFSIIVVYEVAN